MKSSRNRKVCAANKIWNLDNIGHAVVRRSDSLARAEVKNGDVVTVSQNSVDRLIPFNFRSSPCLDYTSILSGINRTAIIDFRVLIIVAVSYS